MKTKKAKPKAKAARRPVKERAEPGLVHCRRLDRKLPEQEHLACPYCYGREADVHSAEHGRFCDYEKGKDAVVFGFPDTHGRHRHE